MPENSRVRPAHLNGRESRLYIRSRWRHIVLRIVKNRRWAALLRSRIVRNFSISLLNTFIGVRGYLSKKSSLILALIRQLSYPYKLKMLEMTKQNVCK
jgi:hypothetical protein